MILNFQLPQRSIPIIGGALALTVGFLCFYSIWRWQSDWTLAHQTVTSNAKLNTTDETSLMIAAIPDNHLFGMAFDHSGDVPVTDLQLRVTGIVKVNDEQQKESVSKVYISSSGQPGKIYQVGDTLPYGVKIYEITGDAVILENSGRLEKLPLPREPLPFKAAAKEDRS